MKKSTLIVPLIGSIVLGLVIWGLKVSSDRIEAAQQKAAQDSYGYYKNIQQMKEKEERAKQNQ